MSQVIYLDYQASTPTDPRVLQQMLPWFSVDFANPHAIDHQPGQRANQAVEQARKQVATLIGAEPREIIFTSGATESNNLAILGGMRFLYPQKNHLITVVTEHKCVLESAKQLEKEGMEVTFLPVQRDGLLDLALLEKSFRPTTGMVSVMMVNNEIGVIQPVEQIGQLCHQHGILYHCDAAQAAGKITINVQRIQAALLSISGHKLYGPKGVGALYVRHRPRVRLQPLFYGGGQERGFRSGTLPTPLCVGLGAACAIAVQDMANDVEFVQKLQKKLWEGLRNLFPDMRLNGHDQHRYPGNLNICFPSRIGQKLLQQLPGLAISSGSACSSSDIEPSYVLRAIGLDKDLAQTALRISFGRFSTEMDVDKTISYFQQTLK